ncbi:TIGR03086 family protein [Actinoplanes sp. TBRC 11911]|uniref:TIGR03086 family metal-binding protein n=1 Tax=Actinoplanes sp. TBRC 11911 TaxID=2729386 RepID=UPI00145EEF90|nr:TIGR03086 family metal-binding protein [Actinoplanes sp. TBRC 11911]NMO53889.1 TIGR03086 family protein [Actinoplanes sp. TBRC 11911]
MTPREQYAKAVAIFDAAVRAMPPDRYTAATPCADWDAHALVNHVVGENRWAAELTAGRTIADVGGALDGDLLGADPVAAWSAARSAAARAIDNARDDDLVALSAGPTPLDEYLRQLAADHLVHAWDLATAAGTNLRLDDDLVTAVATWFAGMEEIYRAYGVVGPRPVMSDAAEPQARLLAMFGRSETLAAVDRFDTALAGKDPDAIMASMTADCVFESTMPPDGERHVGTDAVRAAWNLFLAAPGDHRFTTESRFAADDRVIVQWRYDWPDGHVRGVDLFRVHGGLIAEKLSYVKG